MLIVWCEITETKWIPPFGNELERHLREKKGAVLHASCSAWGLLYTTFVENGLETDEVAFEVGGKPYFRKAGLHFSLSHTRRLCVVAISDRPIGVDVEIVRNRYNPQMVERSLCENEKTVFDGDFTRLWSRKEAVAKMTGKGIVGYPVDIDTTEYRFLEEKISCEGKKYWLSVTDTISTPIISVSPLFKVS